MNKCKWCHEEYTPKKAWQKFCSMLCRDRYWGEVKTQAKAIVESARVG